MRIVYEQQGNIDIFRFFDAIMGEDGVAMMENFEKNFSNQQVIFDFSQTETIDSSCVGSFISILKKIKRKFPDSRYKLVKPVNSRVQKIFAIVHLRELIEFTDSESEAVDFLKDS